MIVFWDTNLFIYLTEKNPLFHSRVLSLFQEHVLRNDVLVTSSFTLGELLAQPLRSRHSDLADQYRDIVLKKGGFSLIDFTQAAAEHYAQIRAATSLKQPDAIQIACAMAVKAELFLTNDRHLWTQKLDGGLIVQGIDATLPQG